MAFQFGQILGGILTSIAEARSLSDRFSRDLAQLYEKDGLLRAFPVPRMELEDIQVELKFAPDGTRELSQASNLIQQTVIHARAAITERILNGDLNKVFTFLTGQNIIPTIEAIVEEAITDVVSGPTKISISTPLKPGVEIETYNLERSTAKILQGILDHKLAVLNREISSIAAIKMLSEILEPVKKMHEEEVHRLRGILGNNEIPIEVLFLHNDLVNLPERVLSSIKLSIQVRNYEWTQVDEKDGEPVRKLIAE